MVENTDNKKVKKKKVKKTGILLALFSLLIIFIMIGGYFFVPQIELKGKKRVVIDYNDKYSDAGYDASYMWENINDEVLVTGEVDSSKLGTYEIVYTVPGAIIDRKVKRIVEVVDKTKPEIQIEEGDIYLCPGSKFKGLKFSASDNYDGDLSSKVSVLEEEDKVTYSVVDSSGNKSSVVKEIIYEDKVEPVINLKGGSQVYSFVGEEYKELGFSVTDNCETNLESKVEVNNSVDITKSGTYSVEYSVSDSGGNVSKTIRKVVVSERGRPGTIYLTFDDGPQSGTTDVILDILKEEGVEATFFVTNKGPDELIKRMHMEGHTVALHTATHNYATVYASVDSYFNDLNTINERVKRVTGEYSHIIRFPGGSSNTISRRYSLGIMSTLTKEVVDRGYKYYDWNVSSGDAAGGSPTPEQIKNNVVYSLRRDRINMVLMHDIKTYTRDALRDIIRYGKDNGYTFEKITMSTEMVKQKVNN